jgi:hypothetical protein
LVSGNHEGELTVKVEDRHRLGTDIAPQNLRTVVGYAGLTVLTYSSAGPLLDQAVLAAALRA